MGKVTGFQEYRRQPPQRQPVLERVKHWQEFYQPWPEPNAREQAARCMDCAVPFCHTGCPLGNIIPDFNDLVYRGRWEQALDRLHATNNFPEFTGRICPAPCEASCVLSINQDPVTIEYIEKAIADRGFAEGWIKPQPPAQRTGKRVAVVGSGPAGLAAAQQLNRAGHTVTVFERDNYIGGLLTLGIPDFKLDKGVVQRRVDIMAQEGITFKTGVNVGVDLPAGELLATFDAVCLTGGATESRDLPVPGRELKGVHLAMEYLTQQNRLVAGEKAPSRARITAEGKRVVILGGGDTGADCLGTAHRQGAEVVHQFEILPEPPSARPADNPWPYWPLVLRLSAAHEEGGLRDYAISTKRFSGRNGRVQKLHAVKVEWQRDATGRFAMKEIPGTDFEVEADLVLLALGFTHPENYLLKGLGVELDPRGNAKAGPDMMTSVPGIFAAGDLRRGQSLVVWAIAEGREAAHHLDKYLMGSTKLPRSLPGALPR
ncbi:MAG: glutamate synthase subunit beta [Dehalococcoidia bacterium]|nr:glutamate synthase subunit beta [Dehalococcoidia bacterium]